MSYSSGILEDSNSERISDNGGLAHEVSEEKVIQILPELEAIHEILPKNLAAFCPWPENLCKAKLKGTELIFVFVVEE